MNNNLYQYILGIADNSLILGQRLGELCGHGPSLETDIACTNISLDLFGQVRSYFQYASKIAGDNRTEDDIALLRKEREYKNVLLVDDSVVRGTTSEQIIEMARSSGAKKVYFASAAPEVRFPNVYGIDMPSANELIAHGRDVVDVCDLIGADKLIFQSIEDLVTAVKTGNPEINTFDTSVFDGKYITNDIDSAYLEKLDAMRNNSSKEASDKNADSIIDMHNEGAE